MFPERGRLPPVQRLAPPQQRWSPLPVFQKGSRRKGQGAQTGGIRARAEHPVSAALEEDQLDLIRGEILATFLCSKEFLKDCGDQKAVPEPLRHALV